MARADRISKPDYRFVVVDDTIYTWGVKDKATGKLVATELRDPQEARNLAEQYNINPSLIDDQDKEASS